MAASTLESIQPYVEQLFDDSDVQKHLARASANLRGARARAGNAKSKKKALKDPTLRRRLVNSAQAAVAAGVAIQKGPEKRARRSRRGWVLALAAIGAGAYVATNEEARTKLLGAHRRERDRARDHMTHVREADMAGPSTQDASASELVKALSEQTSRLVKQEMELAKAELSEKGKQAGIGAGLLGGGGVFALYALGALTATLIAALSLAMDTWLAALIVTVLWAAVAGVMALLGKSRVQKSTPPIPEQSVESVKEDVQWTKTSAQKGRQ